MALPELRQRCWPLLARRYLDLLAASGYPTSALTLWRL
jgi:hypothetical protein